MVSDLELAFRMVDAADAETLETWSPTGVTSMAKDDGTPVTEADAAAETAMLSVLRQLRPDDAFVGEELGEHAGTTGRRWIADGIDGTRYFAAGDETWGTLLALEVDGVITVGVSSSPVQNRRWWAVRGSGAFAGALDGSARTRIRVSGRTDLSPARLVCLPRFDALSPQRQELLERLATGRPKDRPWSHQNRVAEGQVDVCVWFGGDIWDHAAPSIIVEEAGGRFSDHWGGNRLDSRTALYSNGCRHDEILAALRTAG
jgi:histidinol-phosphatase